MAFWRGGAAWLPGRQRLPHTPCHHSTRASDSPYILSPRVATALGPVTIGVHSLTFRDGSQYRRGATTNTRLGVSCLGNNSLLFPAGGIAYQADRGTGTCLPPLELNGTVVTWIPGR